MAKPMNMNSFVTKQLEKLSTTTTDNSAVLSTLHDLLLVPQEEHIPTEEELLALEKVDKDFQDMEDFWKSETPRFQKDLNKLTLIILLAFLTASCFSLSTAYYLVRGETMPPSYSYVLNGPIIILCFVVHAYRVHRFKNQRPQIKRKEEEDDEWEDAVTSTAITRYQMELIRDIHNFTEPIKEQYFFEKNNRQSYVFMDICFFAACFFFRFFLGLLQYVTEENYFGNVQQIYYVVYGVIAAHLVYYLYKKSSDPDFKYCYPMDRKPTPAPLLKPSAQ